jgi:hypothetical protein
VTPSRFYQGKNFQRGATSANDILDYENPFLGSRLKASPKGHPTCDSFRKEEAGVGSEGNRKA